jgi:hypothetical protein
MSYNSPNYKGKKNQNQQTFLGIVVIGLLKIIWWIVTLPFKGIKFGKGKSDLSLEDKNYITAKRLEIEKMLNTENQIELKHTVMEADKLVDYAMQTIGYSGATFADRLKVAQPFVDSYLYDGIWQGHKVRNQIAHEQGYQISNTELRTAARKLLNYIKTL